MDVPQSAAELLRFIDASPSPWHAVETCRATLENAGFQRLDERALWKIEAGRGYYVTRDGSSLIALRVAATEVDASFRIIGAHTDSPGFRVKPRGAVLRGDLLGLGAEIYGGPIISTFADRDLTLAGRVLVRESVGQADSVLRPRFVNFGRPLLRLPTPAIHLNREVNEQGLKFEPQEELPFYLGQFDGQVPPDAVFRELLASSVGVGADQVMSWELAVVDTQPGGFFGLEQEFIASARLDNLASCHAALSALLRSEPDRGVSVCALFDHEEVGSESFKGALGSFLSAVLRRVSESLSAVQEEAWQRGLARSLLLSADMAHGFHPNFARLYDEQHAPRLNGGPVIKINAKQRYATDAAGEAFFAGLCAAEGVPCQRYVHRNNLPCGSTIGPLVAARLGIRTIDVGNAMWSMHSARESAGAHDHEAMIRVMERFYRNDMDLDV